MKPKDVLLGVCIVVLLASEIFLFSANQQKRAALNKLAQAQHDAEQARSELQQLKADGTASQSTELSKLRAESQNLAQKLAQLQSENTLLRRTNDALSLQLGTARQAVVLQQQHLEQLQTESQQSAADARNSCINNLRLIEAAKTQWALEADKAIGDVPTVDDLLIYLPGGIFPVCPSGGTYTIGAVGMPASCSVHGQLPVPAQ